MSDSVVGTGNGVLSGMRFHSPRLALSKSGRSSERIGLDSLISSAKDRISGNYTKSQSQDITK